VERKNDKKYLLFYKVESLIDMSYLLLIGRLVFENKPLVEIIVKKGITISEKSNQAKRVGTKSSFGITIG
jgi:hypothetical protein